MALECKVSRKRSWSGLTLMTNKTLQSDMSNLASVPFLNLQRTNSRYAAVDDARLGPPSFVGGVSCPATALWMDCWSGWEEKERAGVKTSSPAITIRISRPESSNRVNLRGRSALRRRHGVFSSFRQIRPFVNYVTWKMPQAVSCGKLSGWDMDLPNSPMQTLSYTHKRNTFFRFGKSFHFSVNCLHRD